MLNVENLKIIMKAKGVNTLRILSEKSGIPYSTLNYMMNGHDMYIGTLANIANALNEPIETFINMSHAYVIYYEKEGVLCSKNIIANNLYEVTACYMM